MSGIERAEAYEWRSKMAYTQIEDPDIFFSDNERTIAVAKQICKSCPVINNCLGDALKAPLNDGVVAGLTRDEMADLRKNVA